MTLIMADACRGSQRGCKVPSLQDFLPDDFDRNDYILEIPPGVDSALILAMVLAYEKMEQTYD